MRIAARSASRVAARPRAPPATPPSRSATLWSPGKRNLVARHDRHRARIAGDRRVRSASPSRTYIVASLACGSSVNHSWRACTRVSPRRQCERAMRGSSRLPTNQSLDRLIGEDAVLRFGVLLHRMVAVEMIGRDVEQHGDARLERRESFRAGTTRPRRRPNRRSPAPSTSLISGLPMLPPTRTLQAAAAQQMADQRGRRRFSLRSGDRDDRRLAQAVGELDLADHRHVGRVASRRTTGDVGGTPGESTARSGRRAIASRSTGATKRAPHASTVGDRRAQARRDGFSSVA